MSEHTEDYYANRYEKSFGWQISNNFNAEILIFEGNNTGRCMIVDGMKVVVKIIFADDILKINTVDGYAVQLLISDKVISVIKEE